MSKSLRLHSSRSEARPLGTPRPKQLKVKNPKLNFPTPAFVRSAAYVGTEKSAAYVGVEEKIEDVKILVDSPPPSDVESFQSPITVTKKEKTMTLTLKGLNKKGNAAIYGGGRSSIRVALVNFEGKKAPQTIEVSGMIGPVVKEKAKKLTKEERAALPKPTMAERIAKREAALARDKARLAAAENQPSM